MATPSPIDRWSLKNAFQAARAVRRAEFGRQAVATLRPRGVVGLIRRRAPLPIMLYLASWEGRLCWQDLDGFAVLEPPVRVTPRPRPRQSRRERVAWWLLRRADQRWDTAVAAAPLVVALLATAAAVAIAPLRGAAVWCALAFVGCLFALAVARAVASLRWLAGHTELAQLGALDRGERASGARPADHWSMSLCHQARPERTDELLRLVAARLTDLVAAHTAEYDPPPAGTQAEAGAGGWAGTANGGTGGWAGTANGGAGNPGPYRYDGATPDGYVHDGYAYHGDAYHGDVRDGDVRDDEAGGYGVSPAEAVETLVCLTGGITTADVRSLVATSTMAVSPDPAAGDVVVLLAPTYPVPAGRHSAVRRTPPRAAGFFAWYATGFVVVSLANARFIAIEAGVPYAEALRWLASRLLFSDTALAASADTAHLGHGLGGATVLGWLTSLAGVTTVLVGAVAARQYLAAHRALREDNDAAMTDVITRSRVLILVATAHERDAVIDAVVARTGRDPIASCDGDRTIFALGKVGGADLLLAHTGEGMTRPDTGPGPTARAAIRLCRPDYVVLVGTCFGLRPDEGEQRIGDILVSLRVESLDRHRVSDRFGGTRVLSRGVDLGPSQVLLERCRSAQRSWSRHRARIHFGLMLSASPLAAADQSVGDLRRAHPEAIGGESQSSGIHDVAARYRVPWVMVSAISDWGAGCSDEFEDIAARNAADFATHMVAIGSLPQP